MPSFKAARLPTRLPACLPAEAAGQPDRYASKHSFPSVDVTSDAVGNLGLIFHYVGTGGVWADRRQY